MKVARKIIKNSLWLISGEVLSKIITFFLIVILARSISISDFGKYNLALSFVMIFSVVSDLGLNIFLFREVARNRDLVSKYVINILAMRIILSIIFFIVIFICMHIFNYSSGVKKLIYLFTGWMCFTSITNIFRTSFKAMEVMKWEAIVNLFDNLLRLLLIILFLRLCMGVYSAGIAYLLATSITLCLCLIIFKCCFTNLNSKFDFALWKLGLKEMRFLALVAILIPLFGKFDVLILEHFNGNEAVGVYGAAFKLVWMLIMIPVFLTQAAFPKLSQYAFKDKNKFSILITYLLKGNCVITLFSSLVIFFLAFHIINLVYGVRYFASISVLRILIWCFPLFGVNFVFISGLNAKNKQKINALFIGSVILFNILLAIRLAPKFSYIGTSLATVISLLILAFMFIVYYIKNKYLCFKKLKFTYDDFHLTKKILFGKK